MVTKADLLEALYAADEAGDIAAVNDIAADIDNYEKNNINEDGAGEGVLSAIGGAIGSVEDFLIGKKGERSVFNSPELNELSFRALKTGLGGVLTGNVDDLKSIISSNYPEAELTTVNGQEGVKLPSGEYILQPEGLDAGDATRFVTDVSAFHPAGRIAGLGVRPLVKGAVAGGGTQAAQELAEVGAGGDFDADEVLIETALGPAAQIASPAFGFMGSSAKDLYGLMAEKLAKSETDQLGGALKQVNQRKIVPKIMANPEIIKAANDLNIDLNPAHYSNSEIYKEYELGLKAVPGSTLSAKEKNAVTKLTSKADELIKEFGGSIDKSTLSASVKSSMEDTVGAIKAEEKIIYDSIDSIVEPGSTVLKVIPRNTLLYLNQRIKDLNGIDNLSPGEKEVYKKLKGRGKNSPTYKLLVEQRRGILKPAGLNTPFANTDERLRKNLYRVMQKDERGIISFFSNDLLKDYDKALEIGSKRFDIQENMVKAFGKDLSKSLFRGIKTGIKDLSSGDVGAFSKAMDGIPENLKSEVAVSALNDLFTQGARTSQDFTQGGFSNAWGGIRRNKESYKVLSKYIPKEAMKRINNMALVNKGILDANKKDLDNPSGSARKVLNGMMQDGGVISRVYGAAGQIAVAEGVSSGVGLPGVGAAGVITSAVRQGKEKPAILADKLLTSEAFKDSILAYIQGDKKKANKIMEGAGIAKRWLNAQDPAVQRQVVRQGLFNYLADDNNEEPN